jgi:hypothetical protein
LERALNPLWWPRADRRRPDDDPRLLDRRPVLHYVLLVFAGIWALMEGMTDIVRAFAVRQLHKEH